MEKKTSINHAPIKSRLSHVWCYGASRRRVLPFTSFLDPVHIQSTFNFLTCPQYETPPNIPVAWIIKAKQKTRGILFTEPASMGLNWTMCLPGIQPQVEFENEEK